MVGGVAGEGPHPDRDAFPGDGHADDDLGQVSAVVLGVPPGPHGRFGGPLGPLGVVGLLLVVEQGVVCAPGLPVSRGGVEEDEVDLQVQQVGDREEHRLLQLGQQRHQEVHGPVAVVVCELRHLRKPGPVGGPAHASELGQRLDRQAVGHHGEDDALGRLPVELAANGCLVHRPADAKARPQPVNQPVGAHGAAVEHRDLACRCG